MKHFITSLVIVGFAAVALAVNPANNAPHPATCNAKKLGPACLQICEACAQGFIVNEANVGDGFWRDCVQPIMTNSPQPPKAVKAGHPLPNNPGGWSTLVSQCQQQNPGWGIPKHK